MKKQSYWIIGLLAVAVVVIVVLNLDTLPGQTQQNECSFCADTNEFDENDIYQMLCSVSGKSLNYLEATSYIQALHMKAYGVDGKTHQQVAYEYIGLYADLTFLGQQNYTGIGYAETTVAWLDGTEVIAIMAGSGSVVTVAYGYDTMVLVSNGPYTTYQSFLAWLSAS